MRDENGDIDPFAIIFLAFAIPVAVIVGIAFALYLVGAHWAI